MKKFPNLHVIREPTDHASYIHIQVMHVHSSGTPLVTDIQSQKQLITIAFYVLLQG